MVSFFVHKKSTGKRKKIFLKFFAKNVSLGFYLAYYMCRQQGSKEALSTCEKCRSAPAGRKLHFLSASGTILAPSAGCAG